MLEGATLLAKPRVVPEKSRGITPLWRGRIHLAGGYSQIAYLKPLTRPEFLAEALCAIIGRAHGLPIPACWQVNDPGAFLPEAAGKTIFASGDIGHPSVARWLESDSEAAMEAIRLWLDVHQAAVFDEWIANQDRHPGNLLYDGAGNFWLLDHAYAFGGPNWLDHDLDPRMVVENQLADMLLRHGKHIQAAKLKKAARACAGRWQTTEDTQSGNRGSLEAVLWFLEERRRELGALIDNRAGQPSLLP